jgi:hypothetical protein
MKRLLQIISTFFLATVYIVDACGDCLKAPVAVTYQLNGGRFGDNLHSLTQALWFSFCHNIPLLLTPFPYLEQLKIYHLYDHCTTECRRLYKQQIYVKRNSNVLHDEHADTCLYITTFDETLDIDWNNDDFVAALRELIVPSECIQYLSLPSTMHVIALHVRRGGGFYVDSDHCRKLMPCRFPAVSYYIQALQMLLCHLDGPCYVYLFTDDPDPARIAHEIMAHCSPQDYNRIVIQWRTEGNQHNAHVIEDFFNMMRFTYLIRAQSGFSSFVERLGHCKVAIVPTKAHAGNPYGNVTRVSLNIYDSLLSRTQNVIKREISQDHNMSIPKDLIALIKVRQIS